MDFEKIRQGNRSELGRAFSLIESEHITPQKLELLSEIHATSFQDAYVIVIAGPPGAGKSSVIEKLGALFCAKDRVGVLTIDPSSEISGGSILGDKTRMPTLSNNEKAFIRPSPNQLFLGGVNPYTYDSVQLMKYSGHRWIIVETVGVGQSEITASHLADCFVHVTLPLSGDTLQGIKKGIMEQADLIGVNKADGDYRSLAQMKAKELREAIHLAHPKAHGQRVKVQLISALTGDGIKSFFEAIKEFISEVEKNGFLESNRSRQNEYWVMRYLELFAIEKIKEAYFNTKNNTNTEATYDKKSAYLSAKSIFDSIVGKS